MAKDIQDYLDKGMYGTPQLKPDEQKKYLGTFRERVVFILFLSELSSNSFEEFAVNQFKQYPGGTLLVNALVKPTIQKKLIHLTQENQVLLKLVDTEHTTLADDSIAVVYSLNHAINKEEIEMPMRKQMSNSLNSSNRTKTSTGRFFNSLFSKK